MSTMAGGVRVELPGGTAIDLTGTQIEGEMDEVWGGNRPRLSVGVSHSFRRRSGRVPEHSPPGYRPRYSAETGAEQPRATETTTATTTTAEGPAARPAERARRRRPPTMPSDSVPQTTVAEQRTAEQAEVPPVQPAAPSQTQPAPAQQTAAAPAAARPAARGTQQRSIFYSPGDDRQGTGAASPAQTVRPTGTPPSPDAPPPVARASTAAAQPAAVAPAAPARNGARAATRFTVQAAAVATEAEAIELRVALAEAGFPARIVRSSDFFRVRIGVFTTRDAAEAFARRIRAADFEAWVTETEQN